MRLTRLELSEFRCYHHATIELPPAGLRVYGRNASGKSSLIEAVYLLATTRSPRASYERETINWSSAEEYGLPPYARVTGWIAHNSEQSEIEIVLAADESRGNAVRKRIKLDGRPRRALDAVGTLKAVLFAPEDLNLVLGSPSVRRRYLDISLSQVDHTYIHALGYYGRILEQRNSLLKELGNRRGLAGREIDEQLAYWDGELVTHGAYVVAARVRYLHGLERSAADAFYELLGPDRTLGLRYAPSLGLPAAQAERVIESSPADAQAIVARAFESDLLRLREDELRRGSTLVGPHRDDVRFLLDGRDLAAFGSRGQQRLAVVACKLAELRQVVALSEERPILLLDDVLSELDPEHQDRLLAELSRAGCQVIITATDRDLLDRPSLAALPFLETGNGVLSGDGHG